ncbi:MAG TPA: Flp pilus assembly complex ATPase component TadA [Natronincola sp.]|nr:Flp pilus assembly complex ATPase component TadA [Natronincola sp.]
MRKRLGDILQEQGLIDYDQLTQALEEQLSTGERLGQALVRLGFVTSDQVAEALSEHLRIDRVNFANSQLSPEVINLLPDTMITARQVLPLEEEDGYLKVAMADPLNINVIDEMQRLTGKIIRPVIATEEEIDEAFHRTTNISQSAKEVFELFRPEEEELESEEELARLQYIGDAPGVRLANMILEQAIKQKASDIHLEPDEEGMRVRYRVDGILHEIMQIPKNLRSDVNSRIKIMSNLDITERRKPQDGRIQMRLGEQEVDMRISSLPTVHGEKIVARLLHKSSNLLELEDFGFAPHNLDNIKQMLRLNQGLILVTGPTGSGKSTTLYAFLNRLNSPEKNLVTVEDPVEYRLAGVNHVQVNPVVDLTFSTGLRTVLRQDPDVIMVGEIRDEETGEIAIRSALTGHLVLSTLHTNSAVATVTRLLNMEMESYILSSTIIGILAQRLVRTICKECKESTELTDPVMIRFIKSLGMEPPEKVYIGRGCPNCNNSGYKGRTVVEEVLMFNRKMRQAVEREAGESELWDIALESGMTTLQEAAINKLIAGITTSEEILRTVYSVDMEGDE